MASEFMKLKIQIQANKNISEEFPLYLTSHFCDVLKRELLSKFDDYDSAYDFLFDTYNERLFSQQGETYRDDRAMSFDKDQTSEDKIFSLVCDMDRNFPFLLYATMNKIAKEKSLHYLSLFIILNHKINFNSTDHKFGSLLVFDKKDLTFVCELLEQAHNEELFKDYTSVTDVLSKIVSGEDNKKTNKTKDFLVNLKESLSDLDYISFEEPDEFLNYFDIYNRNCGIDYKKIMLSKDFQKYLAENDFGVDQVDDFSDYMEEYLSGCKMDFYNSICEEIIKKKIDNVLLTPSTILNLDIGVESIFN